MGLTRSCKASSISSALQVGPLKEIFKRCSSFGKGDKEKGQPEDAHKGHLAHFAVYVGENRRRYMVPISWLSHPGFQCLLQLAGFRHERGIIIPCQQEVFQSPVARRHDYKHHLSPF